MHVKNICLMILLLFAVLLTRSRVHAADNRLFPVNGGESYVYTVKNSLGKTWTMKTYVSGAVAMPIISKAYNIFDVLEGTSSKFKVVRSTTTAVYNYDGFGKEYVEWKNAPVNTIWTYTTAKGWTVEAKIEAIETITVPAGTFTGCLKTHKRCTNCQGTTEWYEWIKPKFMLVKLVDYSDENPPVTTVLKSFTP